MRRWSLGLLRSVWYLVPAREGKEAGARVQSESESLSDVFACAHLFAVIYENKVGSVPLRGRVPWDGGGDMAGADDCVGMPGHGGQTVRILILPSLIFYPPFNAPRALKGGSGQLFLRRDGRR